MTWQSLPLGRLYRRHERRGQKDLPVLSVYRDHGVVPRAGRNDNFNRLGEDLDAYKVVQQGDLVLNKMKTWQGSLGVSAHTGIVSPAYFVARRTGDAHDRFLHHLLRSQPLIAEYGARSKGIRPSQWDLPWSEFAAIMVRLPGVGAQRLIADHLDAEVCRIDDLIVKKLRLRELVVARFRALVSEVVANGPSVQVRRVIGLRTSGPRGWSERAGDTGDPFIRSQNLRRDGIELDLRNAARVAPPDSPEALRSRTAEGDVLVGITGANTGWVGIVREPAAGGYVSQHVAVLRPRQVAPEWLAFSLFAHQSQDQLLGGQYGGTKTQLGLADLANLQIRAPGRDGQHARIERLTAALHATRKVEQALAEQIELLRERRQTLITAAVTGELDIPGVAA